MLYNRSTDISKFGNNTYPWRIRRRSNLGHIFQKKKCVLWARKYGNLWCGRLKYFLKEPVISIFRIEVHPIYSKDQMELVRMLEDACASQRIETQRNSAFIVNCHR